MGIPGLTARLLSRANWVTLSRRSTEQDTSTESEQPHFNAAFVDGPGLVYHIHHELSLERRRTKGISIALHPNYGELGQRVISFLEDLEEVGVPM